MGHDGKKNRTENLIEADNIKDVAEPNQQAIDHVKIISDFRFSSIWTVLFPLAKKYSLGAQENIL